MLEDLEIITEPQYSCDSINAIQKLIKESVDDYELMKELHTMLEGVRELNMELRAYARTGWDKAEQQNALKDNPEGVWLDDFEEELAEEGIFCA